MSGRVKTIRRITLTHYVYDIQLQKKIVKCKKFNFLSTEQKQSGVVLAVKGMKTV